jgi:AGZA family xanthine/uracil permease-like MFS transporter
MTMTFFGFMHGERIGVGESPAVAVSDLVMAGIFAVCAKSVTVPAMAPIEHLAEPHAESVVPM